MRSHSGMRGVIVALAVWAGALPPGTVTAQGPVGVSTGEGPHSPALRAHPGAPPQGADLLVPDGADGGADAGPPCGLAGAAAPPQSLEELVHLSWPELEQLYRQSGPGAVPHGYLRGRAIYCRGEPLSGARSAATRALWHGKHFLDDCTLVNQWCGFKAIRARVYHGPSWLDGRPALIMDYCGTSRVWADVRDEVREVAPGLYLGAMYRRRQPGPEFKMFFALQARPCRE